MSKALKFRLLNLQSYFLVYSFILFFCLCIIGRLKCKIVLWGVRIIMFQYMYILYNVWHSNIHLGLLYYRLHSRKLWIFGHHPCNILSIVHPCCIHLYCSIKKQTKKWVLYKVCGFVYCPQCWLVWDENKIKISICLQDDTLTLCPLL